MYAAYQSHQSCAGATASKRPCRSDVSCSSCASSSVAPLSIATSPARKALGDLLQQEGVAVRVAERRERRVRATGRIRPRKVPFGSQSLAVPDIADLGAAADELGPGGFDVVDNEVQPV